MEANRISFLCFLFILVFSQLVQSSDYLALNNNHVQKWSSSCAQHMTSQQLQITANFLYLLYTNAFLDTEVQKYYTPLANLTQIARNNLSDPNHSKPELIDISNHMATIIERISQTNQEKNDN